MVKGFGQSLQTLGSGMARAGLGLGAPLAYAAKLFGGFEEQMARVRATITGITEDEFRSLGKEALRIGRDTEWSSTEAAKAMAVLARSGLKTNEVLKATAPTLQLATAGSVELAAAADIVRGVMGGMAMEAGQVARVADVLATAANAANHDVRMLGEGFSHAAAAALKAGMDLESTAAAMAVLADAGIKGERGGTTVRSILADLKKLSPEAKKALAGLGVSVQTAAGNWRPIADIFRDLDAATKGMGSYARDAKLSEIFDIRPGTGAELLMRDVEKFVRLTGEIRAETGSAARMQAAMLDTLAGSWKLFTSSVEGVFLEVGKALAPLLREWGEALTAATNAVSRLAAENPELFRTLAKVSAGLVVAGAGFFLLGAAMAAAGSIMTGVVGAFAALAAVLKGSVLLYMNKWFVMARQVTWLFVIPGAADAAAAAWGRMAAAGRAAFASIANVAGKMWTDVKVAFDGVADAMATGDLKQAAEIGWLGIRAVWAEGTAYLGGLWDAAMGRLRDVARDALDGIQVMWVEATSFVFGDTDKWAEAVSEVWRQLADAVKLYWDVTVGAALRLLDELKATMRQLGEWAAPVAAAAALISPGTTLTAGVTALATGQLPGVRGLTEDEEAQRRRRRQDIDVARAEDDLARDAAALGREQARREAVDAARNNLKAAADAARAARERQQDEADLEAYLKQMAAAADAGIGAKAADAERGLSTALRAEAAGSFSSFGLGGSLAFGKTVAEQQLDAMKGVEKNTKRIADEGGGRFG